MDEKENLCARTYTLKNDERNRLFGTCFGYYVGENPFSKCKFFVPCLPIYSDKCCFHSVNDCTNPAAISDRRVIEALEMI